MRYILECCRALFSYAAKRRHLSPYAQNPFSSIELNRIPIENAKPIVLFTREQEIEFLKGPRDWRVWVHWRGMADSDSPFTGMASEFRHTESGVNGGNDYPMTVAGVEDPDQRIAREREGIYRTLSVIYYFQHEVGLNWALAEDEGYNTPYNQRMMKARDLRADLYEQAIRMPQWPYVRESRRGIGVYTLRASDLERFEKAKLFPTSVAMGDYFMDLQPF